MNITTHHDVPLEQLSWLQHKVELVCLGGISTAEVGTDTHHHYYNLL